MTLIHTRWHNSPEAAILRGRMELREFAESVLFAENLQAKLAPPPQLTDERPGPAILAPSAPGRPAELRFKLNRRGKTSLPWVDDLDKSGESGRLLHCFANHELLATELMALVLLRFPEAPTAFRRAVLQTLKDEQEHTRWYLDRMRQCGVEFGDQPVSGYFWRAISAMETPLDYVAGLSLTFEQANLDFARFYSRGFAQVGDEDSAKLLQRIYQDEIGHVACGLKWFRKWKDPAEDDWQAFQQRLRFPLSPQRAKGPEFNVEGRLAAGLDPRFIDELKLFAQSKGRTPAVLVFNPFVEGYISLGHAFTPNKHQQMLQRDLENLPQFLCRRDDVVLVEQRPSSRFLHELHRAGFASPEFVPKQEGEVPFYQNLRQRKLGTLRPWGWGPDSLELLGPLLPNITSGRRNPEEFFNPNLARLYSKQWSSNFLKMVLENLEPKETASAGPVNSSKWLCSLEEVGIPVRDCQQALDHIQTIRDRGHRDIVLKEALGFAGHNAIRLLEPELLPSQLRWIERALDNGRQLIIEPWLDRVSDFSVQLEMTATGLKHLGYTGLLNDRKGQYQGNWACPGFARRPSVNLSGIFPEVPDIRRQVTGLYASIFDMLGKQLQLVNYLGPLSIDAFFYQTAAGEPRLKPIVEINPRYTMGRLTLELMHNVSPGSTAVFRLLSRREVAAEGCECFRTFAAARSRQKALILEGEPVTKVRSGFVCLSDPERAQGCLATLEVFPAGQAPPPAAPSRV